MISLLCQCKKYTFYVLLFIQSNIKIIMKKKFLISFLILIVCHTLLAQDKNDSGNSASCVEFSNIFNNIKTLCDKDNGKLWGVNLYTPILCINKKRDLWSNQRIHKDNFKHVGKCLLENFQSIRTSPIPQ